MAINTWVDLAIVCHSVSVYNTLKNTRVLVGLVVSRRRFLCFDHVKNWRYTRTTSLLKQVQIIDTYFFIIRKNKFDFDWTMRLNSANWHWQNVMQKWQNCQKHFNRADLSYVSKCVYSRFHDVELAVWRRAASGDTNIHQSVTWASVNYCWDWHCLIRRDCYRCRRWTDSKYGRSPSSYTLWLSTLGSASLHPVELYIYALPSDVKPEWKRLPAWSSVS